MKNKQKKHKEEEEKQRRKDKDDDEEEKDEKEEKILKDLTNFKGSRRVKFQFLFLFKTMKIFNFFIIQIQSCY